jgi:hypothetical protein
MEKEKSENSKEMEAFRAEVEPKVRETIKKLLDSDDLNDKAKGAKLYLRYYGPVERSYRLPPSQTHEEGARERGLSYFARIWYLI